MLVEGVAWFNGNAGGVIADLGLNLVPSSLIVTLTIFIVDNLVSIFPHSAPDILFHTVAFSMRSANC